ncbi:MAG: hypothetical protein U9Q03_02970 [Patescibacteria group bacterium]|nr:hypothetical protein [Patescibacteria group bacterium]
MSLIGSIALILLCSVFGTAGLTVLRSMLDRRKQKTPALPGVGMPKLLRPAPYRTPGELAERPFKEVADRSVDENGLVRGVFTPAKRQVEIVREWTNKFLWNFGEEDFRRVLATIPEWPDKGAVALVLVPYLPTVKETYKTLWELASEQQDSFLWDQRRDVSVLGSLVGASMLRWELIDLRANRDCSTEDVESDGTLPDAGILAAMALHPEWVRRMDGKAVPYVRLSGYRTVHKYRSSGKRISEVYVPHVFVRHERRWKWGRSGIIPIYGSHKCVEIRLEATGISAKQMEYAIPVFHKEP